jgi:N-acyl-D-amino-acid deacylase
MRTGNTSRRGATCPGEAPPEGGLGRLAGTLLGTALGDALGIAMEGMSAEAIARRFGAITPASARFRLLGRGGFVSDDTEQSALLAQGLARHPQVAAGSRQRSSARSTTRTMTGRAPRQEAELLRRTGRGTHVFDLIIRGGTVVDGTGAAPFPADVGVEGGRIAAVGHLGEAPAARAIDATGLMVAPGFIDIHTHADIALLARPTHEPKVMQGVTTEVFSNCGLGFAPVTGEALAIQRDYLLGLFGDDAGVTWDWQSVAEFLARYRRGIAVNAAYLIPHGAVRVAAMGMADRPATDGELDRMKRLVQSGMEEGAVGLSTGLWYAPMSSADEREAVELCRIVAGYDGFFAIHMRDYGDRLLDALAETLRISERSGCPVQISHLQVNGERNWGRAGEALATIDAARAGGLDVTLDSYPYTAGSTLVQALLPAWAVAGGPSAILQRLADPAARARIEAALDADDRDWNRVVLCGARTRRNQGFEGAPFTAIAAERGLSVPQLITTLLLEEELSACFIAHAGDERDVRAILAHPAQMIGSDGLHLRGKTHPRLYGTFPRLIARYVREQPVLSLAEAVRKMTVAPARRLGLRDRGFIAPGAAADLALFDYDRVRDTATFDDPCRFPEGIPWVIVNGEIAKEMDRPTHRLAGDVLVRGR